MPCQMPAPKCRRDRTVRAECASAGLETTVLALLRLARTMNGCQRWLVGAAIRLADAAQ